MKTANIFKLAILLTITVNHTSLMAETAIATASMLANTCVGCHGANGSSMGPATPSIAGLSRDYFINSMQAYKSGKRPATIMDRIAKGYTKPEIDAMADFFSEQTFIARSQTHDLKKADLGRRLHNKYCKKCHTDDGSAAQDDAGFLAGQWQPYMRFTMRDYTHGQRKMDKKKQEKIAKFYAKYADSGVDALLNFYASRK